MDPQVAMTEMTLKALKATTLKATAAKIVSILEQKQMSESHK